MNIEHILDSNGGNGFKSFVIKKLKQHNIDFYKINFTYEKGTNKGNKKKYQQFIYLLEDRSCFISITLNTRSISLHKRNGKEHHYYYYKKRTWNLIGRCCHGLCDKSKFYWIDEELN